MKANKGMLKFSGQQNLHPCKNENTVLLKLKICTKPS